MYLYNRLEKYRTYGIEVLESACNALNYILNLYKTWRYRNIHSGGIIVGFFAALLPKFMLDNPQIFAIPEGMTAQTVVEEIFRQPEADRAKTVAYIINDLAHSNFNNERILFSLLINSTTNEFTEFMVKVLPYLVSLDFNIDHNPYLLYRAVLSTLPTLQEMDDQKISYSGFTDEGISSLMSELIEMKDAETVYDGACGFSILTSVATAATNTTVYGQDIYFYPTAISRFILLMAGMQTSSVDNTDTLFHPVSTNPNAKFDVFMTHSPIGFRTDNTGVIEQFITANEDGFDSNPRNDQWLFIRRHFQVLKDNGRGIALMHINALNRDPHQYKDTRIEMIEKGYIAAIIELPAGLIGSSSDKWSIVIFDKKGGHDSIYFMDLSRPQIGHHFDRTKRGGIKLDETCIPQLVEDIQNRNIYPQYTAIVSKEEIASHEYRLSAAPYIKGQWGEQLKMLQTSMVLHDRSKAKREYEEKTINFENSLNAYNAFMQETQKNNRKEDKP